MQEWVAASESGEVQEVKAPSRDAAVKLLRWNYPGEHWADIKPKHPPPQKSKEIPVYPEVGETAYAHYLTLARRLSRCRMLPGSYEKRFVRDMAVNLEAGKPLSAKQMNLLDELQWRFRVQLSNIKE